MGTEQKYDVSFRILEDLGTRLILEAKVDGKYVGKAIGKYMSGGGYRIVPLRFAPGCASEEAYRALHTIRYRNELPYAPDLYDLPYPPDLREMERRRDV